MISWGLRRGPGWGQPIAVLASSMRGGGVERVALNLAAEFGAAGIPTDLVLINCEGPLLAEIPTGLSVVDLGARRSRWSVWPLRRYLSHARPRAIIAMGLEANLAAMIASIGLWPRPKLILTVHHPIGSALKQMRAGPRRLYVKALSWLYPRADYLVAVSKGASRELIESGIRHPRAVTIYNGVLQQHQLENARSAEHPWFRDPSLAVVLTAGRLTPAKNQALLLRAFALVSRRRASRLIILGDGPLRSKLERLAVELSIESKIMFLGYQADILDYMRSSDVFVLSSDWEGFGNVLVEAMAAGTPVIATDCPHGPREILEHGKWGCLVPPGDVDALAASIFHVLEHGGIDARPRARDFLAHVSARQYLDLIDDVAGEARGPGRGEGR